MKITETRTLTFSDNTLIESINRHVSRKRLTIQPGQVENITYDDHSDVAIVLTILADDGRMVESRFDAEFIAAAMIRFCIDEKIPVPRTARKRVLLDNGRASLEFTMGVRARNIITPV